MKIKLTNRGPAGLIKKDGKLVNRGAAGLTQKLPPKDTAQVDGEQPKGQVDRIRCAGEVVEIDTLTPDPMNARLHPDRNMEAIEASINQHGQMSPITVVQMPDGRRVVYKGNGTLEALRRLGWTKVAVSLITDMSEVEALAYGLNDNRSAEHARWDFGVVAKIDAMLQRTKGWRGVGWTLAELTALRQGESVPTGKSGGEVPAGWTEMECPECGHVLAVRNQIKTPTGAPVGVSE